MKNFDNFQSWPFLPELLPKKVMCQQRDLEFETYKAIYNQTISKFFDHFGHMILMLFNSQVVTYGYF